MVEHGGYGGSLAAPIAREIAEAAADLSVIPTPGPPQREP